MEEKRESTSPDNRPAKKHKVTFQGDKENAPPPDAPTWIRDSFWKGHTHSGHVGRNGCGFGNR